MPATRRDIRAETMRRISSIETVTVALDPDVAVATAQRLVISPDLYNIDKSSTHLGQAHLWVGRYNEGNKVRQNTFAAVAKAALTKPTTSNYTLRVYGYGTTSTLTPASDAAAIQAAIRAVSLSLISVTVTGSAPFLITLPSASITIELVRVTPSDTTGSVTQGLAQIESVRPWVAGLPAGTDVEILYSYPAVDEGGLIGMNTLINDALKRMWYIDLLPFTSTDPTNKKITFSLSTLYPWLTSRSQILRAYAPTSWRYTASYTVPVGAHTLSLDIGFGAAVTTASVAGSASAAVIQSTLQALLGSNGAVGTVTVTSNSTTRTVVIENAVYSTMALTVSTGATVTSSYERMLSLNFTDGWRMKFNGTERLIEWDQPWNRGYTWFLEVYRRADTIYAPQTDYQTVGTTWVTTTEGLQNDFDQAQVDTNEAAGIVHYLAARQLELFGPGQEKAHWKDERLRAATIAAYIKSLDLPTDNDPGFRDEGLRAARGVEDKGFFSR